MFVESENEIENSLIPDTSLVMAIRYQGKVTEKKEGIDNNLPAAVLSGLRKSHRLVHYSKHTSNVLVLFKPIGAAAFFHEPLHEFFNQSVQANWLRGYSDFPEITEQLATIKTKNEKLALLEKVFVSKLRNPGHDTLVQSAIQQMRSANGNLSIKNLANDLYISQDAFEKRFRQTVGTSPKHFSSIIRMQHAIHVHLPGKSLTHLALEAGYYDQAHFIKDFKTFTGKTPNQFFENPSRW